MATHLLATPNFDDKRMKNACDFSNEFLVNNFELLYRESKLN